MMMMMMMMMMLMMMMMSMMSELHHCDICQPVLTARWSYEVKHRETSSIDLIREKLL